MAQESSRTLKERSKARQPSTPSVVRLLGPVDVVVAGRALALGSTHTRAMLAVLATRAGQVLSAESLIEAIWGDDAPRTA